MLEPSGAAVAASLVRKEPAAIVDDPDTSDADDIVDGMVEASSIECLGCCAA